MCLWQHSAAGRQVVVGGECESDELREPRGVRLTGPAAPPQLTEVKAQHQGRTLSNAHADALVVIIIIITTEIAVFLRGRLPHREKVQVACKLNGSARGQVSKLVSIYVNSNQFKYYNHSVP